METAAASAPTWSGIVSRSASAALATPYSLSSFQVRQFAEDLEAGFDLLAGQRLVRRSVPKRSTANDPITPP